jgi:hypothetical protein
MTTKKSKNYDLATRTNLKHKPQEAQKKKNQNTSKRVDTLFPISNEVAPKKTN